MHTCPWLSVTLWADASLKCIRGAQTQFTHQPSTELPAAVDNISFDFWYIFVCLSTLNGCLNIARWIHLILGCLSRKFIIDGQLLGYSKPPSIYINVLIVKHCWSQGECTGCHYVTCDSCDTWHKGSDGDFVSSHLQSAIRQCGELKLETKQFRWYIY